MSKTIGLALGGGGARGWAHIGVIRALEEHHIPIDYLAGTSIGALVGAIYVRDELQRLEQFANDISTRKLLALMDVSFPGLGLIDGQQIRDFLAGYLLDATLEDCRIPFRCVATNFLLKQEVVLQSGSLLDAVRASISMPGVFVPFKYNSTYLVDGGVVNPVPVNVVKAMGADIAIAVNLNCDPQRYENPPAAAESEQGSVAALRAAKRETSSELTSETSEPYSSEQSEQSEQEDTGFIQGLVDRYQNLKCVLQDRVDDWLPDPDTGMNIFDVIGNSTHMMEQQVTHVRLQIDVPDVLLEPNLIEFGIFDFQRAQPMIERGYQTAKAQMPEIERAIAGD